MVTPTLFDTTPTGTPASQNNANQGGKTATAGTTPTPSPTPGPFKILSVVAAPKVGSYTGTCSSTRTITIVGTITAPANSVGGQVAYDWVHSDNTTSLHHTITFAPGVSSYTVQTTWTLSSDLGTGTKYWVALKTLSPQSLTSAHATFSFHCKREVKSVVASATPTGTSCVGTLTFTFSAVITVTPGPGSASVTYTWKRSDNATATSTTVSVPQDQATVTVTTTWLLGTTGSFWEELVTSAPNAVTSNKATITCS